MQTLWLIAPTELTPHEINKTVCDRLHSETDGFLQLSSITAYFSRSSMPGMIPDIPICALIFIIHDIFRYDALVRRGSEKAHETESAGCGLLNGVLSVRHYVASHLLFLTSFSE